MKWKYNVDGTLNEVCVADSSNDGEEDFARLEVDRVDDSAQLDIAVIGKSDGSLRVLISSDTGGKEQMPIEIIDERTT
ncbi:hypothetical protein [Gordonia sihwensis]|uniref:hypothetical protein n=1 Tax=Gordonia sihwensis TaxID=173559 RepID=UPI003D9639D1